MTACVGEKESRRIKRGSGIIRNSKVLLLAHREGPISYFDFALRDNRFFTIETNSMNWWDFYAGIWTSHNDTIDLYFIDNHRPLRILNYAIRTKSEIIFNSDSTHRPLILYIIYDNTK